MEILVDVMIEFLVSSRQKEGKYLNDYIKRFCVIQEVLVLHIRGPIVFIKIIENMTGFTVGDATIMKDYSNKTFKKFLHIYY